MKNRSVMDQESNLPTVSQSSSGSLIIEHVENADNIRSNLATEWNQEANINADIVDVLGEIKREKVRLEQALFESNEELNATQDKLLKISQMAEMQKEEIETMLKDRSERLAIMRDLEADRDRLIMAKNECEQKSEILLRQKEDYNIKIERLIHEKFLLTGDMQRLKDELSKLKNSYILMENQVNEANKAKNLIEFEKERWAQEKEIYLRNKEWFMAEINERDKKFITLKIDMLRITGESQAEVAKLAEERDSAKDELNRASLQLNFSKEEIARLNQRIKEALETNVAKMNKMEEEMLASERLISIYKEASEDAEKQLKEITLDFEERGRLLAQMKIAFDSMNVKLAEEEKVYENQLKIKDKKIEELNDELAKANDLLKSKHHISLTDDEIAAMSPTAAAASLLIKSGVSLTGIYKEHCRVIAELEEAKLENKRIEGYLRELVDDIEHKAPLLAQQRFEFDKMTNICSNLTTQLETADEDKQRLLSSRDAIARELAYTRAELERCQRDNEDLNRQVRHLLHTIEIDKVSGRDADSPPISAEDRDILWSSIGQLQQANQKLMSDLRETKINQDKMVQEANSAEINQLKESLNDAIKKLESLRDQNSKLNLVVEKLQEQRDSYKNLICERKTDEESVILSNRVRDYETQIKQLEEKAERAEKCLELFRQEKKLSDKILQDRIDYQFELVAELRKTNGKLEGDIEMQKQMQNIMMKQNENDANELITLREKNAELVAKLEACKERLQILEKELINHSSERAKQRSDINSLNEEIATLRSREACLHQELIVIRESNYSNEKIANTIHQIQSRLSDAEIEKITLLEEQLNVAKNENDSLKKFVADITEQHRIISLDLKMMSNKIASERDQALASKKSAEDKLVWKEKELTQLQDKHDQLIRQLNAPNTAIDDVEGQKKEAQLLRNKNNYLDNQLKEMSDKYEVLEKKLTIKEKELEDVVKVSNNIESTLVEQSKFVEAEQRSLQAMLELSQKQLEASTVLVNDLRKEIANLEQRIDDEAFNSEQMKINAQKELLEVEKRLNILEMEKCNADSQISDLNNQLQLIQVEKISVENERNKCLEELMKAENRLKDFDKELIEKENLNTEIKNELKECRRQLTSEIAILRAENNKINESLKEANEENVNYSKKIDQLNENLVKLSERILFLERIQNNSSTEFDDSSRSVAPLHEVIKYLQNENHLALERSMNAELQWKRLQAQQSTINDQRIQLEDEVRELRGQLENQVRQLAEKSEMAERLSVFDAVQNENRSLKTQLETISTNCSQLRKKIIDLQVSLANSEAERITGKSKLQNVMNDLENYRKELNLWKERHSQSLTTLAKFGPQKTIDLTSEIEVLKGKISLLTSERDSLKKDIEKIKHSSETNTSFSPEESSAKEELEKTRLAYRELQARFDQARVIGRKYRLQSQTLEQEKDALEKRLVAKVDEATKDSLSSSGEISKLKQELVAARSEIEKFKQKVFPQRTGWPVDVGSNSAAKTNAVLQSQMKQIEALNQLNKELKNQLEELSNKFKESQEKIVELEGNLRELYSDSETKDELRFRLKSITSMMCKKDAENAKLRNDLEGVMQQKMELEAQTEKIGSELCECKRQLSTCLSSQPIIRALDLAKPVTSSSAVIFPDEKKFPPQDVIPVSEDSKSFSALFFTESLPTTIKPESSTGTSGNFNLKVNSSFKSEMEVQKATLVSTTIEQSNTVSQSSTIFAIAHPFGNAQSNVISGSGDGTNIISSSGVTPGSAQIATTKSSEIANIMATRKRPLDCASDQTSSNEADFDTQETKRQRASPLGQVSTSGRLIQLNANLRLEEQKSNILDDDGAEQEQQENVETTTNPEIEGTNKLTNVVAENDTEVGVMEDLGESNSRANENSPDLERNVGEDEIILDDDEDGDDDISYGGAEDSDEEMEDEEGYGHYDEDEDDVFDDEEDPDPQYMFPRHRQMDDEVIVMDEENEDSGLPADQSTDEADEGIGRISNLTDEASIDEPHEADVENSDANREIVLISQRVVGNDHLELQQGTGSQLSSNDASGRFAPGEIKSGESSEATFSPSREMELSQSALPSENSNVVSASGLLASRGSSPFIVNIESDSRDASSTVVPTESNDFASESQLLDSGDDGNTANAEEELIDKRTGQTDDEAGTSEPSTSGTAGRRRIRIRVPEIDEPSSSSCDHSSVRTVLYRGRIGRQFQRGRRSYRGGRFK